jgi:hypothetical protein
MTDQRHHDGMPSGIDSALLLIVMLLLAVLCRGRLRDQE